jgi:hypothetical protein
MMVDDPTTKCTNGAASPAQTAHRGLLLADSYGLVLLLIVVTYASPTSIPSRSEAHRLGQRDV